MRRRFRHDRRAASGARRARPLVLLALLLLPALPARAEAEAPAPPPSPVEWITLPPQTRAHWELTPAVNEPLRAWIRPQGGADGRGGAAEARVFILFAKKSSAYDTAMRALLGRFRRADVRATFAVENFGGDPARGAEALRRMETGGYDLGLAMGSAAVTFLHKTRPDPSVPVVTICAKDPVLMGQMPDYASGSGRNIAYTSLNVPVALQLDYLREIVPGLSVIGVLYATENTSTVVTQVEPLRALAAEAGIGMIDVAVRDRSRAAEELQTLLPEAVREIRRADPEGTRSLFWITGATSVFREIETIDARSGGVPVLSAVPDVVRAGDASAVLSIGVSFESNAHLAAHYALRILRGRAAAAELPVGVVTPPDVAINFRKARAAGLRVPFRFFEAAGTVYDPAGLLAREEGRLVRAGSGE